MSVASILFYKNEVNILENSVIESGQMQAAIIGSSLASAIIFDDEISANSTLRLLDKNKQVKYAAVRLPNGSLFAEFSKDDANKSSNLESSEPLSTWTSRPANNQQANVILGKEYLEVIEVISEQGSSIGYLYIKTSLDRLSQQRIYYGQIFSYVFLFSLFLAFILSSAAQRIITQPLRVMVDYVQALSTTKDYRRRLRLHKNDELGMLANGFNHMLNVVAEREQELKNQSSNLQAIVDERTEQLYHKAHFDSLTLLPNRYLLSDRLEHAILTADRKKEGLAILFMDLDRFKLINDSLGHDVGDELLKAAANRLKEISRDSDTVARLGGDEFIYLAEGIEKPEDAGRIAQKINEVFKTPFVLANYVLHVSTSIGISVYPSDGQESSHLLKNADVSMYHAKEQGPGSYCFYRDEMNQTIHQRLEIENQLRNAIDNNEFHLVFQPQLCVNTNDIVKLEALLRWTNPELGCISPAEFIPIAEEIGMINQLGKWVINEACRHQKFWQEKKVRVAVNVSSSQLLDVSLVDYIKSVINEHQTEFEDLEFEITEEVFLEHSQRTIGVLSELQYLGIKIAIDDFGTGYSSLSYLKDLPVDTLKLDGMFVMDLDENRTSRGIVSSTIILAHSLNLKIVAECVETKQQLDFLKSQQCDYVQGFYLHKPLTADEVIRLL